MKKTSHYGAAISLAYFIISFCGATLESANLMETKWISSYKTLSADELMAKIQGRQLIFLIDCRPKEEYCAGHIPQAANVPMDSLSFGEKTILKESIEDVQKQAGKTLSFVLIDVDSQEEYMPKSKIEEFVNHLPEERNQEVILYCRRPDCTRSPMAIRWAEALGYKNVLRYEGGWKEWSEKNYPVERYSSGKGS